MDRLHAWAIGFAGVLVAAVLTSLVAPSWKAWAALAIAFAAFVTTALIVRQAWLCKPRLLLEDEGVERLYIITMDSAGNKISRPGEMVKVNVANRPRGGAETAHDVYVVSHFRRDG